MGLLDTLGEWHVLGRILAGEEVKGAATHTQSVESPDRQQRRGTHSKKVFPSYVSCSVQMKLEPFVSVCKLFTRLWREEAEARPTCCERESKSESTCRTERRESKRDEPGSNLVADSKDSSVKGREESMAA